MKINIACPSTGGQKVFDIDDEKKLRIFMELRISDEVDATPLGDEFKGYILRIVGGSDKDGFPMKQGVLVNHRVRLLLKPGSVGYRRGKRDGVRRRRTVRGCIVANDLSVLNTVVVKKGEQEIPGLTDKVIPRRVGPKRVSKICKLFNLSRSDNVLKYLITRTKPNKKEGGKPHVRGPKVQRLVTSRTLMHRRRYRKLVRSRRVKARREAREYKNLLRRQAEQAAKTKSQKSRGHTMAHKMAAMTPEDKARVKRLLMLRHAVAHKRAAEYRAKQRHLAGIKAAQKRAAERKEAEKHMTPEQIETSRRRLRAFHRRLRIEDEIHRRKQVRHAMHLHNKRLAKIARITHRLKTKKYDKKTTRRLNNKVEELKKTAAQLPELVRKEQSKREARAARRKRNAEKRGGAKQQTQTPKPKKARKQQKPKAKKAQQQPQQAAKPQQQQQKAVVKKNVPIPPRNPKPQPQEHAKPRPQQAQPSKAQGKAFSKAQAAAHAKAQPKRQ